MDSTNFCGSTVPTLIAIINTAHDASKMLELTYKKGKKLHLPKTIRPVHEVVIEVILNSFFVDKMKKHFLGSSLFLTGTMYQLPTTNSSTNTASCRRY